GNGGGGNGGGTTGQPVPEPGVAGLFLLGSLGLLFSQRRRIQLAPHRA
ncbi:MAG: PEP-CTERM sorting domain-containing protein, partial [Sphingomonadaceae bacterium]|nr:PEP-CTERM sorting domain-containing protein [Sphingomonadaceae bacterium]